VLVPLTQTEPALAVVSGQHKPECWMLEVEEQMRSNEYSYHGYKVSKMTKEVMM